MVAILNPNWQPKYTNPPIWAKFGFPSRLWCCELKSIVGLLCRPFLIQNGRQEYKNPPIWAKFGFPSRLWCCELIFIVVLLCRPFWIQNGRQGYKNPPIWAKFGFQIDFVLANWYPSSFLELGAILWSFRSYHILLLLFFLPFFSPRFCPTKFSETDDPIFTELHRKVDPHLKRCTQVLEFSKWPPMPWKPWTYVKIFDLNYIGNCQRDFHKTWHIY